MAIQVKKKKTAMLAFLMTACGEGKKWENLQMLGEFLQLFFLQGCFSNSAYMAGGRIGINPVIYCIEVTLLNLKFLLQAFYCFWLWCQTCSNLWIFHNMFVIFSSLIPWVISNLSSFTKFTNKHMFETQKVNREKSNVCVWNFKLRKDTL